MVCKRSGGKILTSAGATVTHMPTIRILTMEHSAALFTNHSLGGTTQRRARENRTPHGARYRGCSVVFGLNRVQKLAGNTAVHITSEVAISTLDRTRIMIIPRPGSWYEW